VITLSSRFSMTGVKAGVGIAATLVLIVGFGTDPAAVLANPQIVIAPLALILCAALPLHAPHELGHPASQRRPSSTS